MSERDELAAELAGIIKREYSRAIDRRRISDCYNAPADAILAAGYRKPRTISTVEELAALGHEAVVRDAEDYVLERWGLPEDDMWATPMNGAWIRSAEVTLPATVLWEPQP